MSMIPMNGVTMNSNPRSRESRRMIALLFAATGLAGWMGTNAHATTVTSTWTGGVSTLWSNANNWSPNTTDPSNGNGGVSDYNVIIGTPSPTVLDLNVTIDLLTINTGGNLNTNGGTTLAVNGPTITDNGTITVNGTAANIATIFSINGNTTLTGNGTLSLDDNGNPVTAQLNTATNITLTQDANHTMNGHGAINAALVNNGTVNANVANTTLLLQSLSKTNNNLFKATAGTLQISSITVTQGVSGQISAAGGTVSVLNSTVSGGTFTSSLGGVIQVSGSSTLSNITNSSNAFSVVGGATVSAPGNIIDNGTITVNNGAVNAATILSFSGGVLSGNGTLFLDDNTNPVCAQLNGNLTQAAGHTITGHGAINAALTNNGTVNATGGVLTLQSLSMVNNNLMEATTGTLTISGITVTQGTTNQILAANGTVNIVNATVVGGILASSGGGVIQVSGSSTLNNITNTSSSLHIIPGATVSAPGNIIDNGTITVSDGATNAITILSFSGGVLSGNGTLFLDDNTNPICAQLNGNLTQAAGHTITGHGIINAALTNNGTVSATGGLLTLQSNSINNNNLIEATTGNLTISSITVTQGATSQILSANGTVTLSGATVIGGILASSGGGFIQSIGTSTINGLTNNGTLKVIANTAMIANGNIVDNGTITVSDGVTTATTTLTFGGGVLSGIGTLFLDDNGNPLCAQLNGNLTQSANHTITGHGVINATFVNNGVVNANGTALTLNINSPTVTNTNLLEATNGGTLAFGSGVVVTNTGALISGASGNITLNGGTTITGGTLTTVGSNTITVTSATLSNVTLSAGTLTNITGNDLLTLTGTAITNNGTITVNTAAINAQTSLTIGSNLTISGTGTITLNDGGIPNAARLDTATNVTLTQASGHTINGDGNINGLVTNNGTVNANVANNTLNLNAAMTNNNLIEATTGILSINGITVTQAAGAQIAASPGNVVLSSATISGGTLNGSGNGTFQVTSTSTLTSLTDNAPITITGGVGLNVNGNFVDNGNITVNTTAANAQTSLTINGGLVSGNGTVHLNGGGIGNAARLDGTLTQIVGHTVDGNGNINAAITNNGTINANMANTTLNINGAITNNSLLEATLGTLSINSVTVTQGPSGQITASPGNVILSSATIANGTLNRTGNGTFQVNATSTIANLTNNAPINITGGVALNANGNIVDNSNITINTTAAVAQTSLTVGGGNITGTGTIFLNSGGVGNAARLDGSLTQGVGHTITGQGNINATLINNGNVSVVNGGTFLFGSTVTSSGNITSGSNSSLAFNGVSFTNSGNYTNNGTLQSLGSISNSGNFTQNGTQSWSAANFTNSGNATISTDTGSISASPVAFTNTAGLLKLSTPQHINGLAITGGNVTLPATANTRQTAGVVLKTTSMSIAPTSVLDMTNHDLIIGNSNLTTINTEILNGFGAGPGGAQITSSTAIANGITFLVPIDATANGISTWDAVSVNVANSIIVKYTYFGDATLDGKVDGNDFSVVAGGFHQTTPGIANIEQSWLSGDLNLDGVVDGNDFSVVAGNFGATTLVEAPIGSSSPSFVPEPASLAILGFGAAAMLTRRRRSSR